MQYSYHQESFASHTLDGKWEANTMSRLTTHINCAKTARLHLQEAEIHARTTFERNIVAAVRALQVSINNVAAIGIRAGAAPRKYPLRKAAQIHDAMGGR